MRRSRADGRSGLLYRLRYRAAEYFLRTLIAVLRWLPPAAPFYIARLAEPVSLLLFRRYRKRMRDTVEDTLGRELSTEAERRTVVRRAWTNFAHALLETVATLYVADDELCSRIDIEGEEHLREALARKKGVLAMSAHFGNFGIIGPRLVAQGYEFSVVIRMPREPRFAALQSEYFARAGIKIIPARPSRDSVPRIIGALRRNEVVLVVPDEFKTTGVAVDFLGRQVPAPRGPITIARRTGAAVLPVFMVRDRGNRLTLHVEPEIRFAHTGDREADLRANARLFVREIEKMVRRHPDQWSWMGFRRPAGWDA